MYALFQVPAGMLADRFGARRMLTLYVIAWSLATRLQGVFGFWSAILISAIATGAIGMIAGTRGRLSMDAVEGDTLDIVTLIFDTIAQDRDLPLEIQALISRLQLPILKIALLSVVNALAIWAIPAMASNGSWVMMAFIVVATIALDYLLLTKRFIPAKYVVIGAIFLTAFQIIPIIFTIFIAFTNYSTGNIGTKSEAVATIQRDSAAASPDSTAYDMVPAYNQTGDLVLLLTPQESATESVPADATDTGVETEFGADSASPAASAPEEFGTDASAAASAPAEFGTDASAAASAPAEFGPDASASAQAPSSPRVRLHSLPEQ